jgi:anti-sigma regulatory factor (Ser/Thr protein kinase)
MQHLAGRLDPRQRDDVQLAISEAITNAVEHAIDPEPAVVDVVVATEPVLKIAVRDHGQWRPRTSSMDRGRGSTIMSGIADVSVLSGVDGTTVTLTFPF